MQNVGVVFRLCCAQLHRIEAAFRESERVCRSPEKQVANKVSDQSVQEEIIYIYSNAMEDTFIAFNMVQQIMQGSQLLRQKGDIFNYH
jgi:hypothetical protein